MSSLIVEFLGSFLHPPFPSFPDNLGEAIPEIALVGRSNAGKSSLINHFLQRKQLAYTSSTPGKTQTINLFLIKNKKNPYIFADLPGYGFAQRSKKAQKEWSPSLDHYLEERKSLKAIFLLIDIRREWEEEEYNLIEWAKKKQKPLLLIFTKSDTMSLSEQKKSIREKVASAGSISTLAYSIRDGVCRKLLEKEIKRILFGLTK